MITTFGRFLRKLRIDRGELIKDMAKKLGVTASYLSAVETGKRNIPTNWVESIAEQYDLDTCMKQELRQASELSATSIRLPLENVCEERKQTAILFAREFDTLDTQKLEKIRNLLISSNEED